MDLDRRDFLFAAAAAAVGPLVAGVARKWKAVSFATAPKLRPGSHGLSGQVCARCGAEDHTALDQDCPLDSERMAAIQRAARGHADRGREAGSWI